jgi:alkanesulfonate monooxygenase SsuD/methylene tetrahydromethanopterin reductase-like flavin-dependent oxidoreductase (luciferase family)
MSIFSVQDHYPTESRTVPQLYAEVLAQAELADQLGYDTFWVAEHHFHEYGAVPNPAVMLSSIAQHTKRLRLGTAISILTFHNPLTVAESYAMVDILSGGRLIYGVGSGYLAHEFSGYSVDPAEKRERFDECLAAVKQLLSGQRTTYSGKFSNFKDVKLNIEPIQKPIPIFLSPCFARRSLISSASKETICFACHTHR